MTKPNQDPIDEIFDKLIKDVKFHKRGIVNARTPTSEMHYNDILKVNVKEAKQRLLQWRSDYVMGLVEEIQTLANDNDLPSITTWKQGQFIDGHQYDKMPEFWKMEQKKREKTLIRPYGGTNNGLFQISATERAADIAVYLQQVGELLAKLRAKNERGIE